MTPPSSQNRSSRRAHLVRWPRASALPKTLALAGIALGLVATGQATALAQSALAQTRPAQSSIDPSAPHSPRQDPRQSAAVAQPKQDASPALPPLPETLPDAVVPLNGGIVGLTPGPAEDLGMGLLQPQNLSFLESTDGESSPLAYGRWLSSVALPLYVSPGGDHWGWIVNGWLMINGYEPLAIGQDASFSMLEARPGLYSFPVLEQRPDGWFRFQYTPAGSAWAHVDHLQADPLNGGSTSLAIQPWEEVFPSASQIRFRRHGLSQALRTNPSPSASLRSLVVPNSRLRPLAIDGDWMRVEVIQPVQGCTVLPGHTTEEGWLRWRDENQALLIWTVNTDCSAPQNE